MNKIELLAPAGSYEALVAAVESGADAVYLGGSRFNARAFADNFTDETLSQAVKYAHIRGVKVYVTVNILISDKELSDVIDYIRFLYTIDVDAIIVQDVALIELISNIFPDLEVHCSTQMTVHNTAGARHYAQMGVKRVVLARELSIGEVGDIARNAGVEVEIFVHGALCVSYSGQCLMSSLIGGRSGNRGRCAQPCRKKYTFYDMENRKTLAQFKEKHLISTRDLNTYKKLKEVVQSGATSLKIEGRMKRPEYVAIVVKKYREAIDQIMSYKDNYIVRGAEYELESAFNREFTEGYLFDRRNADIISADRPDNRGIFLGKVLKQQGSIVTLSIQNNYLHDGDGIEILNKNTKTTGAVISGIKKKGRSVKKAEKGDEVQIFIKDKVEAGAAVNKTLDSVLYKKAKEEYYYENLKKIPIQAEITIKKNHLPVIVLSDKEEHTVTVTGTEPVMAAEKVATTAEKIREQMTKTGDTPYGFEYIDKCIKINIEEGSNVPARVINNLRRDALQKLSELRQNRHERRILQFHTKAVMEHFYLPQSQGAKEPIEYIAGVRSALHAESAIKAGADTLYILDDQDAADIMDLCKKADRYCYYVLPPILRDRELPKYEKLFKKIAQEAYGLVLSNIGQIAIAKGLGIKKLRANYTLNIFNAVSANYFYKQGMESIGLSPELNLSQIKTIGRFCPAPLEAVVYGFLPVMTTEFCPISSLTNCKGGPKGAKGCPGRQGSFGIMDDRGKVFPVITGDLCRIQILNSNTLFVAEDVPDIINGGIRKLRMDFYIEKPEDVHEMIQIYKNHNRLNEPYIKEKIDKIKEKDFTRGHFFRGVD